VRHISPTNAADTLRFCEPFTCKSHNYPGEQVVQDGLLTRIIVVKAINLMLGFTPYTLNEREHLRMVTRLRIWGRSSESFAREWDRGGRARLVTRAFDTWPGACRLLA